MLWVAFGVPVAVADQGTGSDYAALMRLGSEYRQQGQVGLAIDTLRSAGKVARTDSEKTDAATELGRALIQGQQYESAVDELEYAYQNQSGVARATLAIDLGVLAQYRGHPQVAARYYRESISSAGGDPLVRARAELSLARIDSADSAVATLRRLSNSLAASTQGPAKAAVQVSLAGQAAMRGEVELAYRNYTEASSQATPGSRLQIEALSGLAQLYEDGGKIADARRLNDRARGLIDTDRVNLSADLLLELEWRAGRLHERTGGPTEALAAYQRAAEHLEQVRQDLPILYLDGRSSYGATIVPLYQALLRLLFDQVGDQNATMQARYLARARDIIELTHQSEMQDFLGDRCVVTSQSDAGAGLVAPEAGIAYLYTVELLQRTELLLVTPTGIIQHRADIPGLRLTAEDFAEQLRYGHADYLDNAQALYDALLRPFEAALSEQDIETLVVVPDGSLRLVSFGALHDGSEYAIEKLAIATTTGISMTRLGESKH